MSRLFERIENFNKAYKIFSAMQKEYTSNISDMSKLALAQSFEITFEIGWKVLKDYLEEQGIVAKTPKEVIKQAFHAEIIPDGQTWIDMAKDRNITSHEYNQDKVDLMLERTSTKYFNELTRFSDWLEKYHG